MRLADLDMEPFQGGFQVRKVETSSLYEIKASSKGKEMMSSLLHNAKSNLAVSASHGSQVF